MSLKDLNARFTYTPDQGERWKILKARTGPLRGDCEDYSLTLLWMLSGRSMVRFWLNILSFRYTFWYCTFEGEGHFVMYRIGHGWIDNIQRRYVRKLPNGYRLRYPLLAPAIVVKFAWAWWIRK
ncbi:MAG: hypothetical protein COB05_18215 [Marinobacter sp.]|nr:MAG: hypothetical protein COB05_18215 [Marinobacter sp.]